MTGQQRCGSWTMTRSILPRGEHDQACPFTRLRAHTDGAVLQARSTPEHSAGGARGTALTVEQQEVFMYTVMTSAWCWVVFPRRSAHLHDVIALQLETDLQLEPNPPAPTMPAGRRGVPTAAPHP